MEIHGVLLQKLEFVSKNAQDLMQRQLNAKQVKKLMVIVVMQPQVSLHHIKLELLLNIAFQKEI
jgi:hypothetical protein